MHNLQNIPPNLLLQTNQYSNPQSNQGFYSSLTHYQPLCITSANQQKPISTVDSDQQQQQTYSVFLINQGWWKSFICILFMNALFLLTYFKFVLDTRPKYIQNFDSSQPAILLYVKSEHYNTMVILCISSLTLIDLSYLLTQFLNPGVRNLAQVPESQLRNANKIQFCQKCNQYKNQKFTHCSQCQVCIWNYDHHCGFFGKCIGGRAQFWAFLFFMASVTAAFLILLGCVTVQLGAIN